MKNLELNAFIRQTLLDEAITNRALVSIKDIISKTKDFSKSTERDIAIVFDLTKDMLEGLENSYNFPELYIYMPFINKLMLASNSTLYDAPYSYAESAIRLIIFVIIMKTQEYHILRNMIYQTLNLPKERGIDINTIPVSEFLKVSNALLQHLDLTEDDEMYSSTLVLNALKDSVVAQNEDKFNGIRQEADDFFKNWDNAQYETLATYQNLAIVHPTNKTSWCILGYGTKLCTSIKSVFGKLKKDRDIHLNLISNAKDLIDAVVNSCRNYPNDFIIIDTENKKLLYQFGIPFGYYKKDQKEGQRKAIIEPGQDWFNGNQDNEVFNAPRVSNYGHGKCLIVSSNMPEELQELFQVFAEKLGLIKVFTIAGAETIDNGQKDDYDDTEAYRTMRIADAFN